MIYCVDQLTKSFGNHTALRNLFVEISEPGIYGILGPNGAGKSTFIKLMLKILTPSSGNIYYNGKNIEHAGNDYFRVSVPSLKETGICIGICLPRRICVITGA